MTETFHARRLRVNLGGEFTQTTGLRAVLSRHFEKSRFYRPKVRIAHPQISRFARKRRSTTRLQTDARAVLHATVPSSLGPARKHTRPNLSRPRGVGPK